MYEFAYEITVFIAFDTFQKPSCARVPVLMSGTFLSRKARKGREKTVCEKDAEDGVRVPRHTCILE